MKRDVCCSYLDLSVKPVVVLGMIACTAVMAANASRSAGFMARHSILQRRKLFSAATASSPSLERIDAPTHLIVRSALSQGCVDYSHGWAWQQLLLSRRLAIRRSSETEENDPDVVLLLEHRPVYTLGRGADENNLTFLQQDEYGDARQRLARSCRGPESARLSVDRNLHGGDLTKWSDEDAVGVLSKIASPVLAPNGAPIYRVERGGEVTFHGPGQLVVYPVIDLKRHPYRDDLHWFLRMVEEVIIESLRHYDIEGTRDEINTGVWVDERKIAAVGVSASRWITTHGFALNVCPDLTYFDTKNMYPCGIEGREVVSMAKILQERGSIVPSVGQVSATVLQKFSEVFAIEIKDGTALK